MPCCKINQVWAKINNEENEEIIFEYYPDEIHFNPSELIGLTVPEAISLKCKKDVEYLKS